MYEGLKVPQLSVRDVTVGVQSISPPGRASRGWMTHRTNATGELQEITSISYWTQNWHPLKLKYLIVEKALIYDSSISSL